MAVSGGSPSKKVHAFGARLVCMIFYVFSNENP